MNDKLVNMDDVELIHKKNVSELIELLNILNAEVLTKTHEISKDLKDSGTQITISKEELENKLEMLDKYFVKLDTIQKQVLGDRTIDKKFESYLKKIDDIYNLKITSLNEELEITKNDIQSTSVLAKKELFSQTEDLKKSIFEDINTKLKVVDKLAVSQNVINFSKNGKNLEDVANKLKAEVENTKETLKEVQNLRKRGVAYFVSGVAFGAIVISVFWWSKGFLGI